MNDRIVPHVSSSNQLPLFDAIEIPLSRGQVALIDPIDADLAALNWYALKVHAERINHAYYAKRNIGYKPSRSILLHRVIMERILDRRLVRGEMVDHVDGNSLNNTRANLRIATQSQNNWNSRLRICNSSGYKGVSHRKDTGRWEAKFWMGSRCFYLGCFDTPEEAHAAYMEAAKRYAGEFARGK